MIADWTVEVSPESPILVLPWDGWLDLRRSRRSRRDRLQQAADSSALPEAIDYPELVDLLAAANTANVASSKVDVFPVGRDEVDPELAEAGPAATRFGLGSYLDLVALDALPGFHAYEQVARSAVSTLQALHRPTSVVEIVVRPAQLYDEQSFGWTLYAIGFGADATQARATWSRTAAVAVEHFVAAVDRAVAAGNG